MDCMLHGVKESDTTERLLTSLIVGRQWRTAKPDVLQSMGS